MCGNHTRLARPDNFLLVLTSSDGKFRFVGPSASRRPRGGDATRRGPTTTCRGASSRCRRSAANLGLEAAHFGGLAFPPFQRELSC